MELTLATFSAGNLCKDSKRLAYSILMLKCFVIVSTPASTIPHVIGRTFYRTRLCPWSTYLLKHSLSYIPYSRKYGSFKTISFIRDQYSILRTTRLRRCDQFSWHGIKNSEHWWDQYCWYRITKNEHWLTVLSNCQGKGSWFFYCSFVSEESFDAFSFMY